LKENETEIAKMKVKEIAEVLNAKIHGDSEKEIYRFIGVW